MKDEMSGRVLLFISEVRQQVVFVHNISVCLDLIVMFPVTH